MTLEKVNDHKNDHKMSGRIYFNKKTKHLCQYIPRHCYALIDHEDIDEQAALALIEKRVKAVLNYSFSMTGNYASVGTEKLLEADIPVFDLVQGQKVKEYVDEGDRITIVEGKLWVNKGHASFLLTPLMPYTSQAMQYKIDDAKANESHRLKDFIQNTLTFAQDEMEYLLQPVLLPPITTSFNDKSAVIVTRGSGYKEDLLAILPFISEHEPVLIGVDGGADAIFEAGYVPHIVIGDMDSVSERVLSCAGERVVHAYMDGNAPGLEVIHRLGLTFHLFPSFGTSEDVAHLLAYEAGARHIVAVGSHTCMLDFLEKGRKGMGSTLLVRLKIGDRLIDAKGIRHLYPDTMPDWEEHMRPGVAVTESLSLS